MKKLSLKLMMIISFLALMMMTLLGMSFFVGDSISRMMEETTRQNVTNSFIRENQEIERKFSQVEDSFTALNRNNHLIALLRTEFTENTLYEHFLNQESMRQILHNAYMGNHTIDNIILHTSNGNFVSSIRNSVPYLRIIENEDWFHELVAGNIVEYSNPNSFIELPPVSKPVYIYARRFYDYRDLRYLGVVIFFIDVQELTGMIEEIPLEPNMGIVLLDNQDSIIYKNSNADKIAAPLAEVIATEGLVHNGYTTIKGENYFTVVGSIEKMDWTVLSLSSESYIQQGTREVWRYTWMIAAVLATLSCLLIIFIVLQLNKPIGKMLTAIKKVGEGDLNVRIEDINYLEFDLLQDSFNQMVEKVDDLISDVKEKEQEKQHIHLMMLEAQINPHFIYNTLDGIKWVALMQNDRETAKMITGFVRLLKIAIYTKEEFITVQEEVSYLKDYLMLIEKRYNTQIDFIYDIAPETVDFLTLKLVIQPFVENSIFHGILDKVPLGVIKVSIYVQEPFLVIEVEDNGVGFNPEVAIKQSGRQFSGIGLENVKKRIKLRCGDDCDVVVHSEINKGTKVMVTQQLFRKGERKNDTGNDSR
jgi:two-component system sensor histidine kinase YesM